MIYQIFKPCPPLQEYIQSYYIWEHSISSGSKTLAINSAPNGYTGMVIQYGNPYSIWGSPGNWEKTPQSFIAGQFTKKYKVGLHANVGAVGIVFLPGAMSRLLKIPSLEFTDKRIDLNSVLGYGSKLLEEQILETNSHEARIKVLDDFFMYLEKEAVKKTDLVDASIKKIVNFKGLLPVNELSDYFNLSQRHFRRLFTDKVGLSPKVYSRIKRFNYISYLTTYEFDNWQDIVHKGGFYDQAHFIKDFCHFTGKKPSEFVNYSRELVEMMGGE